MKKLIILFMIAIMASTSLGATYAAFLRDTGVDGTTIGINSQKQLELLQQGLQFSSGLNYYVDSTNGSDTATGLSWDIAVATIDEGINKAAIQVTAGRDLGVPTIYVREGHTETLSGADAVDADIACNIIGLGYGSKMPILTLLVAADEFVIGADNVSLTNLRFEVSSTSITSVIDIQDGIDYASITDCVFTAVAAGDGAVNFINLVNNNTGCVIAGNTFDSKAGGAAESAIMMDADTDQTVIFDNLIQGDYSVACIESDTTLSTEVLIKGNILINGSSDSLIAQPAIDLLTGTTGYIVDNFLACNVATVAAAMETCDAVMIFGNSYNEDVGSGAADVPWNAGGLGGSISSVTTSGDD